MRTTLGRMSVVTPFGMLERAGTTKPYSRELTGMSVDEERKRMYVSDDGARLVRRFDVGCYVVVLSAR